MLYSRTLLIIHFKYGSVYMSIPNSLTFQKGAFLQENLYKRREGWSEKRGNGFVLLSPLSGIPFSPPPHPMVCFFPASHQPTPLSLTPSFSLWPSPYSYFIVWAMSFLFAVPDPQPQRWEPPALPYTQKLYFWRLGPCVVSDTYYHPTGWS